MIKAPTLCRQQRILPSLQIISRVLKLSPKSYRTMPNRTYSLTAESSNLVSGSAAVQDSFKKCMSKVASQAMIVTCGIPARKQDLKETDNTNSDSSSILDNLHGSTVSSVSSLSVFPRTLVSLNLQIPSATSECSHRHGWVAIHLLPSSSEDSVRLIKEFSKGSKYLNNNKGNVNGKKVKSVLDNEKVTQPFNSLKHDDFVFTSQIYENHRKQNNGKDEDEREAIAHAFHSVNGEQSMERMLDKGIEIPILSAAERVLICEKDQVFRVDDHEIWVCEVRDVLVSDKHRGDSKSTGGVLFYNRGFHGLGEQIKKTAQ